ncbi:MAG: hypothetical protein P8020_00005 [Acidobacteriota bacterium]|jgi:hypothetical protein
MNPGIEYSRRSWAPHSFLWIFSGAIWWICAHTMSLLVPFPGPWLPISVATPVGALMGLIGRYTPSRRMVPWLLASTGFVAGACLGWVNARGELRGDTFLPPTNFDEVVAVVVCSLLGVAANLGCYWLMATSADRPIRLLALLLLLVVIMLAAVTTVTLLIM